MSQDLGLMLKLMVSFIRLESWKVTSVNHDCPRQTRGPGHPTCDIRKCQFHWATLPAVSPSIVCAHVLSHISCVWLFATPWTVAHQAPLSMGFSRQEYWSGLPFPPPGHLPSPVMESASLESPALAGGFFTISATWEVHHPLHWALYFSKDFYGSLELSELVRVGKKASRIGLYKATWTICRWWGLGPRSKAAVSHSCYGILFPTCILSTHKSVGVRMYE